MKNKRIYAVIPLLVTGILYVSDARCRVPGDIDGSGDVSLRDVITALQIVTQSVEKTSSLDISAEINHNAEIGLEEAIYAMQVISGQKTVFSDVSESSGIAVTEASWGNPVWGDFDNDGRIDILVGNHGSVPSLFHNNRDGTFTDIIRSSGIVLSGDRHGMGCGDYDNDGDIDIFFTFGAQKGAAVGDKKDELCRNNGDGTFSDVTPFAGTLNASGRGRGVNWTDYNSDGYLDLFITNYQTPHVLYRNNKDGTFTDKASSAGIADAGGTVAAWADYDNDGRPDIFMTGTKDQLWRNKGNGTFTEKTASAGLTAARNGRGIAYGDYNNDGNIDLYISRGYDDNTNMLSWDASQIAFSDEEKNKGDGFDFTTSGSDLTFRIYSARCPKPESIFIGTRKISPSEMPFTLSESVFRLRSTTAGEPSFVLGRDQGIFLWKDESGWHIRWSNTGSVLWVFGVITGSGTFTDVSPLFKPRNLALSGTLYRNNGDGTFTDITRSAGMENHSNNQGAAWGDYNNDGYPDLYVVNSGSFDKGNGANMLYRNNGDGTFDNIAQEAGAEGKVAGRGEGVAWGDYDNDGFLDLYLTNGSARPFLQENNPCLSHGPHLLYRNKGNGNNWLKVKPVGTVSNRDGIGAKLILHTRLMIQYRQVNGGEGNYFSQGITPVHFGLGSADIIDSLKIVWPSGVIQEMSHISPNQTVTVIER